MTRLYLALWIGLVACVVVAQAQTDPCAALKLPGDNSPIFDLSPLEHQSFVAYASTQFTTFAFTFGVCSTVACNGESSVSVCQRATNGVEVVAALWQPSSVPTLYPQFSGQTGIGIVYTYPANVRAFSHPERTTKSLRARVASFSLPSVLTPPFSLSSESCHQLVHCLRSKCCQVREWGRRRQRLKSPPKSRLFWSTIDSFDRPFHSTPPPIRT